MSDSRRAVWLLALTALTSCWVGLTINGNFEGIVMDQDGPIMGVSVGWQGQCERTTTDAAGRFRLSPRWARVTASKPGFRIAAAAPGLTLKLARLPMHDNDDYAWIDPHPEPAQPNNCGNCHGEIYREWRLSAHANAATNPQFLGLFAGIAADGLVQPTWNAQAEHPEGSGVCAKCHAPTLQSPTLTYDVREAEGVARSGIHCDYCHKIAEAPTGNLGTRFGRDGLHLLRPANGDLLSFGPLDDAVRPGESFACLPFYKQSQYCAACHEGIVFGVHAYGTYSEWLESPARQEGKQCQDCHMAPTGTMTNIAPGHGGIERNPRTLASHQMPGGQLSMLRHSVKVHAVCSGQRVDVEVVAQRVGHRVPTGFSDRHLVLVVAATDVHGEPVPLVDGPRLDASAGKWRGQPGVLYGKQLRGEQGRTPVPFWLPVLEVTDTRLHPEIPERRAFVFGASAKRVRIQLWYRRFWQQVADARGWRANDLLIHESSCEVGP